MILAVVRVFVLPWGQMECEQLGCLCRRLATVRGGRLDKALSLGRLSVTVIAFSSRVAN